MRKDGWCAPCFSRGGREEGCSPRCFCGDIHLENVGVDGRILGRRGGGLDWIHLALGWRFSAGTRGDGAISTVTTLSGGGTVVFLKLHRSVESFMQVLCLELNTVLRETGRTVETFRLYTQQGNRLVYKTLCLKTTEDDSQSSEK